MKKKKKISTERIISVCAVILFFAAWYLVTALELVDPNTEGNMGFICRSFNTRI